MVLTEVLNISLHSYRLESVGAGQLLLRKVYQLNSMAGLKSSTATRGAEGLKSDNTSRPALLQTLLPHLTSASTTDKDPTPGQSRGTYTPH